MKYLASEILEKAGVNIEETVGKVGISIGGINVNTPDHIINVQDATTVEIIVGAEAPQEVELGDATEPSEAVTAVLQARHPVQEEEAEPEATT